MAGSGPWSIKGIDPKARAVAKEAAQRQGMTLGEWLSNKMLEPDTGLTAPAKPAPYLASSGNFGSISTFDQPHGVGDEHVSTEIENLAKRLEATEHRSTLAITGIDQMVLGLLARLESVEGSQQDVAESLEKSLQTLDARLEQSDQATEEFATKLSRELKDTARRIDTIGEQSDTQASKLRHEVEKDVELINNRSDEISQRLALAEKQTDAAIRTLEASFVSIDSRLKKAEQSISQNSDTGLAKKFDDQFAMISRELVRVVAETRGQLAAQIEAGAANPKLAQMDDALNEMRQKFASTESRHANTLEQIAIAVSKLGSAVETRLQKSEDRSELRLKELQNEQAEALDRVGSSMAEVAQRLELRFEKIDQAEQDKAAENDLEERLRASEMRTAQLVEEALERVHRRLDQAVEQKDDELSPVQQALSKLTDRLAAIEERSAPPFADLPDDLAQRQPVDDASGQNSELSSRPDELVTPPSLEPSAAYGEISASFDQPGLPPLDGSAEGGIGSIYGSAEMPYGGSGASPTIGATANHDFMAAARRSVLETSQSPKAAVYPTGPSAPSPSEGNGSTSGGKNRKLLVAASVFAIVAIGAAASVAMLDFGGNGNVDRVQIAQQQPIRHGVLDPVLEGSDAVSLPEAVSDIQPNTEVAKESSTQVAMAKIASPSSDTVAAKNITKNSSDAAPSSNTAPKATIKQAPPVERSFAQKSSEPANIYQSNIPAVSNNPPTQPQMTQSVRAVVDDANAPISLIRTKTTAQRPSLQQAANSGDPIAQYQYASSLVDQGQGQLAAVFMKRAAERGLPAAQYQLAKYYENGTGLGVDENEARRWTERAANGGNRRAMHNLAMFHAEGRTVPQSYEAAAKWFEEAALLGLANSQFNLALLYEQGLGVPKSLPDAYAWYAIAAKAGDRGAEQKLEGLRKELPERALSEAKTITERFKPRPLDLEANGVFRNINWARPQVKDPASVSRAQLLLARMGYNPGPADGSMGEQTRLAVIAYERDNGLAQTGLIDSSLLSKLERGAVN